MSRDYLVDLGVKVNDMVGGFAGGVVSALVMRRASPWQAVATVIAGALTANYLAEHAQKLCSLSPGASAFLVGLTAMVTMNGIIEAARKWRPPTGGPPNA